MMVVFSVIFLLAFVCHALAGDSCKEQHRTEHGFALVNHVYHSFSTHRLSSCYIACNMQVACQSFNYNLADKICQFNNDTKEFRPGYFVEKATSVYAHNPDSEPPWRKLNSAPVCFGAKESQFGKFKIKIGGSVNAVKLVHLSGNVTCNAKGGSHEWSNFGCARHQILTLITTSYNEILLPESKQTSSYTLPGYDADSDEIVFAEISIPLQLSSGQELRVWYSEDLTNGGEEDNAGTSCVDVYANYM